MRALKILMAVVLWCCGGFATLAHADSPTCTSPETKLSWPTVNPIWEMCWLPPDQSVGADGSGMELRKVYFKGHLVFTRAHAPMLFAEYKDGQGGNCYRDWKNDTTPVLSDHAVQNQLGISIDPAAATTSCDRSHDPTASYGTCPYQLAGYPNATASCFSGVAIEDGGDHVTLTTQYRASWYMYSSRWTFFNNGTIEPAFGFGNNNGTYNTVTHWHHNYWRMEFDIDAGNNTVSTNGVDQSVEFSDLRNATGGAGGGPKTWEVRNPVSGNGYKLIPGSNDYVTPTNESGRNFHTVDVMATQLHAGEYADRTDNPLGACTMNKSALVNSESLLNTAIALYYHVSVRDSTSNSWPPGCTGANCIPQDSMECKKTGPTLVAFGPWVDTTPTHPAATVAPGTVDVVVDQGASATDLFGITNSGEPGSSLSYTLDLATTSCASPSAIAWLSVSPLSGAVAQGATSTVTATVDASSLSVGSHSAFVCVHSNDAANPLISVPVTVTVDTPAAPTAVVSTGSLAFTAVAGQSFSGVFSIGNNGAAGSTLHFTVDTTTPAWLSASPTSGSIAQGASPAVITATANAASLAPGAYTGTINVHTDDTAHPTLPVNVTLTVTAPNPVATTSTTHLGFALPAGGTGNENFTLSNGGPVNSTLHFTIDTAPTSCSSPAVVAWLSATPASGSVAQGQPAATISAAVDTAGLAAGTHTAFVCVHTDDPAHAVIAVSVSLAIDSDVIFFNGFEAP